MSRFKSASASHVGMVRKLNEDAYVVRDNLGLWAVADGMGGHQSGDVASRIVARSLESIAPGGDLVDLVESAKAALEDANRSLVDMADQFDTHRVPGSTVAVLLLSDTGAAVLWAGDSRVYRLRDGHLRQITHDHSHVQELLDQKLINEEDAEKHPMANVITRAIGIHDGVELDILEFDTVPGDRYLLCSDGLSRLLTFNEIERLLRNDDLEEAVQSLMHTALVRGAPDNVTLVSVMVT